MHVTELSESLSKVVKSMDPVQARYIGDVMMKQLILAAALMGTALPSNAVTWWVGSVMYGNVCRAGNWYTIYPAHMGQPVGTNCPVRNSIGSIIAYGFVTTE